jgi:serine/threonine protein kinase, bacterial
MKQILFRIAFLSASALSMMIASCTRASLYSATTGNAQVTTLAGTGKIGSANGPNLTASFGNPYSIAVDTLGNVFVGDIGDNSVRVINPIFGVSLLSQGYGGLSPAGLAVDAADTVYCVDYDAYQIMKISPSGVVTVFAGNGQSDYVDGPGKAASFTGPYGAALDAMGNLYVADGDGNMIRKISPSGVVTTLAGNLNEGSADGTGTAASFDSPLGVAVNAQGTVYVADANNNCIRQISPSGVVTTLAGNSHAPGDIDDIGANATFDIPSGIAVDKYGNIYVADSHNNKIRKITPAGVVTTLAGSGLSGSANGTLDASSFNNPIGVAVDSLGNVYVADSGNLLIRKITQ